MSPEHPWRRLRAMPHVTLRWVRIPGVLGLTDGHRVVVMHPDQSQVQRRCTIAHEVAHIELGHTDGCIGADERAARELAARRLVKMPELLDAYRWAEELEEVADCLAVDVDTLLARIDALTPEERDELVDLYRETERGC